MTNSSDCAHTICRPHGAARLEQKLACDKHPSPPSQFLPSRPFPSLLLPSNPFPSLLPSSTSLSLPCHTPVQTLVYARILALDHGEKDWPLPWRYASKQEFSINIKIRLHATSMGKELKIKYNVIPGLEFLGKLRHLVKARQLRSYWPAAASFHF